MPTCSAARVATQPDQDIRPGCLQLCDIVRQGGGRSAYQSAHHAYVCATVDQKAHTCQKPWNLTFLTLLYRRDMGQETG